MAEKEVLQKIRAHPQPLSVTERTARPSRWFVSTRNLAITSTDRLLSIEQQIGHDVLELLAIDDDFGQRMEFLYQLDSGHSFRLSRVSMTSWLKVGFDGFEFELVPQDAKAADVKIDSTYRVRDRSQGAPRGRRDHQNAREDSATSS